jgi:chromosome segregation ATPase
MVAVDIEVKTSNRTIIRVFVNSLAAKVTVYRNGKAIAWSYYPDDTEIEELAKTYLSRDMYEIIKVLNKAREDLRGLIERIKQLHTMIALLT